MWPRDLLWVGPPLSPYYAPNHCFFVFFSVRGGVGGGGLSIRYRTKYMYTLGNFYISGNPQLLTQNKELPLPCISSPVTFSFLFKTIKKIYISYARCVFFVRGVCVLNASAAVPGPVLPYAGRVRGAGGEGVVLVRTHVWAKGALRLSDGVVACLPPVAGRRLAGAVGGFCIPPPPSDAPLVCGCLYVAVAFLLRWGGGGGGCY